MTFATMASGRMIDLIQPDPATVDIRDIAIGLATANRFNGANARRQRGGVPFSVAQHSTVVARLVEQLDAAPLIALQALLHDGHEAITGDMTTPCKEALGDGLHHLLALQRRLDIAIHAGLGVPLPVDIASINTIGFADRRALATEWRDLQVPGPCPKGHPAPANFHVTPLPWHVAEKKFLDQFERLSMLAGIVKPKIPPTPAFAK